MTEIGSAFMEEAQQMCNNEKSHVPILDLSLENSEIGKRIHEACTTVGFFYVSNHGIPQSMIDDYFVAVRGLFALPLEEKMTMFKDKNNRGYTPYADETLDPSNQASGDTKEGFYFGREIALADPEAKKPLHGPNQWPKESLLPGFRAKTEEFQLALKKLGLRVLSGIALALNLPENFFCDKYEYPVANLRLLRYTPEISDPENGKFAAGAHSDYGAITILVNDNVPGLQINLHGEWVDVESIPGAFIVNIGDMLERWTNKKFKSTVHRVINRTGQERYSMPFFFDPNFDTLVECLPQCCGNDPPLYPPTTSGHYLLEKYVQTHQGFEMPSTI